MSLPNPTVVQYNGFTFPVESNTKADLAFVYDAAGRTVVQTNLTLTVTSDILGGATQDTSLDNIRAALERPGGQLVVTGIGLGTLAINTANGRKDLAFGPKPRTLSFVNNGAGRTAKIVWRCEVAVLGCLNSSDEQEVMESTYEITFATNEAGLLTRVVSGSIRIPMTRNGVNNNRLPDNVDSYFEKFVPDPAEGYHRTISRTIDRSKTSLNYTITDTQLAGNPLPAGIVAASASHSLTSQGRTVTATWLGTLTATYEMQVGRNRADAFPIFLKMAADRIDAERKRNANFFPTQLTIGEPEIYGRQSAAFTLVYALIFTLPPGKFRLFPTVGLWRPVPGSDWKTWAASLADGAQGPRGLSGAQSTRDEDAIVDLCLSDSGRIPDEIRGGDLRQINAPVDIPWAKIKSVLGISDKPDPTGTWLSYQCQVVVEETNRLVVHVPLPTSPTSITTVLRTPGALPGFFPQTDPGFILQSQASPPPIMQDRGSPGYYIRLIGRALRFAYEVPRPVLRSVGGVRAIDANDPALGTFWRSGLVGWTTHPIYMAQWNLRYFIPRGPGAAGALVPIPPHPFQLGQVAIP